MGVHEPSAKLAHMVYEEDSPSNVHIPGARNGRDWGCFWKLQLILELERLGSSNLQYTVCSNSNSNEAESRSVRYDVSEIQYEA